MRHHPHDQSGNTSLTAFCQDMLIVFSHGVSAGGAPAAGQPLFPISSSAAAGQQPAPTQASTALPGGSLFPINIQEPAAVLSNTHTAASAQSGRHQICAEDIVHAWQAFSCNVQQLLTESICCYCIPAVLTVMCQLFYLYKAPTATPTKWLVLPASNSMTHACTSHNAA